MPIVSTQEFTSTEFDYIVVGGGTTGLSLAVRLSEDENITVGVIEAGAYDPDVAEINVPGLLGRIIANPKYDWSFFSTPQAHANNRLVLQPRGKALGGTSMLNFQCMFRPTKEELDVLEEFGNEGWNWKVLLECFRKSETTLPYPISAADAIKYAIDPKPEFHGTNGPIIKSLPAYKTQLHGNLLDALESLGVPRNPESNGGNLVGAFTGYTSVDSRAARRSYAASAYYEPNKERRNLLVITEAQVTKVLLDDGPNGLKKCAEIEFIKDSVSHRARPPVRDVIISAGTLKTPHILELSGIGNKNILAKHGIECKVDLPGVGENLQDHIIAPTIAEIDDKYDSLDALADPNVLAEHMELYKQQKGFLAGFTSPCFAFAPARTVSTSDLEIKTWEATARAQCELDIANAGDAALQEGLKRQFAVQLRWLNDPKQPQLEILNFSAHFPMPNVNPTPGKKHMSIMCALAHPLSRGSVHLASADPLAPPSIDPNYFANPADLDILARGIDFSLRLWETESLKGAVRDVVLPKNVPPAGGEDDRKRLEKIKEHLREHSGPVYHPVGTAAMMRKEEGGVVDPELRVYGTSNVRVADVSILPLELSVHIQSAAYAIAEKATDILRKAHQ